MTAVNIETDHTALRRRGHRQTGISREVSTTTDLRIIMADIHRGRPQIVVGGALRGERNSPSQYRSPNRYLPPPEGYREGYRPPSYKEDYRSRGKSSHDNSPNYHNKGDYRTHGKYDNPPNYHNRDSRANRVKSMSPERKEPDINTNGLGAPATNP